MKKPKPLAEAFDLVRQYAGCQDHSCLFVKPEGMGTNGGCRCSDRPFVMAALAELYKSAQVAAERERELREWHADMLLRGYETIPSELLAILDGGADGKAL